MEYPLKQRPIFKFESEDLKEANLGAYLLQYMLSVASGRTLYLGQCSCVMARELNVPIVSFSQVQECVFCEEMVELLPIPRVEEGKWIYCNPTQQSDST